jgi:hypothetical protein
MLERLTASLASFVNATPGVWTTSETLHFMGLCLLFGAVLVINLRMLGMMRSVSFADLHGLLPVGIVGFVINLVTGMLFFIAIPEQYTQNIAFQWKMILLVPAAVSLLYLTASEDVWAVGSGDDAPLVAKLIAAGSIVVWIGVLYFGRMLPYIGNSF